MPTQFFKVTRAPEAAAAKAQEIKHALMDIRSDTEWDVKEFIQPGSKFPTNLEEETFRHLTEHFKRNRK